MIPVRSAINYLLLLFLLARSFVPVGYMHTFGSDGKVQIVICTGHGPATVSVDSNQSPHGTPHSSSHDVCPFAHILSDAVAHVDMPVLPIFVHGEDKPALQTVATLPTITSKPWFSQGPPVFV